MEEQGVVGTDGDEGRDGVVASFTICCGWVFGQGAAMWDEGGDVSGGLGRANEGGGELR